MCQVEEVKEVCIDMYSSWSRIIESYVVLFELAYTYEYTYEYKLVVDIRMYTYVVLTVLCCQLVQVGVCTTSAIPNISLSWCICIEYETV